MQILAITGATGFVGRHLVSECISQGCFELRLLTRDCRALEHLPKDRITLCEGDLLRPESLKQLLLPGSTLIHLAYLKSSPDANVRAAWNLIDAVKQSGVKRVVHCSTAVVVGPRVKGVVTEETKPRPRGKYQQTKLQIEEILRAGLQPKVELAVLRPTEIIGRGGQGLYTMINRLSNEKTCKNLIYHCILKHRRFNYVSLHNVVAALVLLACSPIAQMGEIYNISDDDDADNNYASLEEFISSNLSNRPRHVIDIGLPVPVLSFLFKLLPGHSPPDRVYSHSKISSMGYEKVTTLRSAVSEMLSADPVCIPGVATRRR